MSDSTPRNLQQNLIEAAIQDIDPSDPDIYLFNLQNLAFSRIRKESPIHYCKNSAYGSFWSISKLEHALEIEKNYTLFSSVDGFTINDVPTDAPRSLMRMDPPEHWLIRQHLAPMNTRDWLARLELFITDTVTNLIDRLPCNTPFDWVREVSTPLSSTIFAELMGAPAEDASLLNAWSEMALEPPLSNQLDTSNYVTKLQACKQYVLSQCTAAESSKTTMNLMTMLMNAKHACHHGDSQLFSDFLVILIGGMETVRHAMTGSVLFLDQHPCERKKLYQDLSLLRSAASETFRLQTPILHMRRTAIHDVTFHEHHIKSGDKIIIWYASANQDEEHFSQPETFVVDRPNHNNIAFGAGPHQCIGKNIAYLEVQSLWRALIERELTVKPIAQPERIRSNFIKGYSSLAVELNRI